MISSQRDELLRKAVSLFNKGKYRESLDMSLAVYSSNSLDYTALLLVTRSHLFLGNPESSLEFLSHAIEHYPLAPSFSNLNYLCKGEVHDRKGQIEEVKRFCSLCKNHLYDDLMIGLMTRLDFDTDKEKESWDEIKQDLLEGKTDSFDRMKIEVWDKLKS